MPWLKIISSRTWSLNVLRAGLSSATPYILLLKCAASDGSRTFTSREAHCLIELRESLPYIKIVLQVLRLISPLLKQGALRRFSGKKDQQRQ